MKKSRSSLAFLLVFMLAVALASLVACGGSQETKQKDTLSVNSEPAEVEAEESEEPEDPDVTLRTDPFWVMVVGDDRREGTVGKHGQYADGKGRSDTLMLVRVDPKNYKLTLVTVPRDTQAWYEDQKCKINETYHKGGIDALKKAVKELTGVEADYYLITTFVSFQNLVDDMGGLTIDVPIDEGMTDVVTGDWVEFSAGENQTLNGKEALVYARERHAYEAYNGNLQEAFRQTNDRYILKTMIMQILSGTPDEVGTAVEALYKNFETDWDVKEIVGYAKKFCAHRDKIEILAGTGPYDGDIDPEIDLWLAYRDEDTWARVIAHVNEGGDPTDIVPIMSVW
ncbi:MAG: LCP family protein [Eggerthellaceae bacterium]|nr:LCP family protein [Eggerthellaceae bacterium]